MASRVLAVILLAALATTAAAGKVETAFGAGVLGVPWGTTLTDLVGTFPQGDHMFAVTPGCRAYWVREGQSLLGIPRERNGVLFGLDKNNRVAIVAVAFSYDRREELRNTLASLLGAPSQPPKRSAKATYGWRSPHGMAASVTEFGEADQQIVWLTVALSGQRSQKEASSDGC
jgi:hypothetical protein